MRALLRALCDSGPRRLLRTISNCLYHLLISPAYGDAALTWLISGLRAPDLPGAAPGCLRARFQREHSRSSSWKGHESGLEG